MQQPLYFHQTARYGSKYVTSAADGWIAFFVIILIIVVTIIVWESMAYRIVYTSDDIKKIREDYESRHKKQIEKLQSEFTNFGIENDYHRRHLNSCKCSCHALG